MIRMPIHSVVWLNKLDESWSEVSYFLVFTLSFYCFGDHFSIYFLYLLVIYFFEQLRDNWKVKWGIYIFSHPFTQSLYYSGIYGVGKAAEVPPALVVLSHIVPNSAEKIAWVGKGIVFDTGGLCIKTKVRAQFHKL